MVTQILLGYFQKSLPGKPGFLLLDGYNCKKYASLWFSPIGTLNTDLIFLKNVPGMCLGKFATN